MYYLKIYFNFQSLKGSYSKTYFYPILLPTVSLWKVIFFVLFSAYSCTSLLSKKIELLQTVSLYFTTITCSFVILSFSKVLVFRRIYPWKEKCCFSFGILIYYSNLSFAYRTSMFLGRLRLILCLCAPLDKITKFIHSSYFAIS